MKKIVYIIACVLTVTIIAACSEEKYLINDNEGEGSVIYPSLRMRVSEMTMDPVSRALLPMSPDDEKYVKSAAIFEFDREQMHQYSKTTFHYVDFVKGTVDGIFGVCNLDSTEYGVVDTDLEGMALKKQDWGMLCLVANVSLDQVDQFYKDVCGPDPTARQVSFEQFKKWSLPFSYKKSTSDVYNDSIIGQLDTMYMFGYYQGEIDPEALNNSPIDLGRLASRLDITIVNETGSDISKRMGYHLDNVCHSGLFFPMQVGMPTTEGAGRSRTVICAGDEPVEGDDDTYHIVPRDFKAGASHTRYFYVGAHAAADYSQATKLHLFYDTHVIDDCKPEDGPNTVRVPLCNVIPSEAADVINGYSLSRNTRYHFTIRLKSRTAKQADESRTSRSVEYGDRPGDIIVYLP